MRKSKLFTSIVGLMVLIITLGCAFLLFFDGKYLPNQPCRPILYRSDLELRETFQPNYQYSSDSLEIIASFYDKRLNPMQSDELAKLQSDFGIWEIRQVGDDGYIYRCRGKEIFSVGVKGCIYVYKQDNNSVIETVVYRSSDAVMPCRDNLLP